MAQGIVLRPKAVEKWSDELPHAKQKVTKFRFYFHDIVRGKNPTAVQIAQANMTVKSSTFFRYVATANDPLTAGPEPNSTLLGSADENEIDLHMTLKFVFTTGEHTKCT